MPSHFTQPGFRLLLLFSSLYLGCTVCARCQLCTGSLGDPVVKITFGAGSNFGPPLAPGITDMQYVANQCPNDGQYTIASSTANCFGNTWYTITQDHTGDPNGYFMLINASYQPAQFYIDTINGLCGNTTYQFSAWILNMLVPSACSGQGIEPNITFDIETPTGTVLQTYNTQSIPSLTSPIWNQYGFYFTTPSDLQSVLLRMSNNAPGGCGNDLALDDITFRPCGPLVTASVEGNYNADTISLCQIDATVLHFAASLSPGYATPMYQWQISTDSGNSWTDIQGATSTFYTRLPVTAPGNYSYRLNVANGGNIDLPSCRISSNVISVTVYAKPVPAAQSNIPVCNGDTLVLTAATGTQYAWQGPGGFQDTVTNSPSPVSVYIANASAADDGTYYVTVSNPGGCVTSDSVTVTVRPRPVATLSDSVTLCKGSSVTLEAGGGARYLWSPATGLSATDIANPVASPDTLTTYQLNVFNQYGCTDTASVSVYVLVTPIVGAGPDKKIMQGQSVTLDGTVNTPDVTLSWAPVADINDPSALQPVVTPPVNTTYVLTATSTVGCGTSTDSVFVRVLEKVTIPNAFSPNGDGINDVWNIKNLITYPESQLQVFNRYGQKVFESNGYAQAWDGRFSGKPLPQGTYYYVLDLKNNLPKLSGWVFIVY